MHQQRIGCIGERLAHRLATLLLGAQHEMPRALFGHEKDGERRPVAKPGSAAERSQHLVEYIGPVEAGEIMRPVVRALLIMDRNAFEPVAVTKAVDKTSGLVAQRTHLAFREQPLIAGNPDQHLVQACPETELAVLFALAGDDGL